MGFAKAYANRTGELEVAACSYENISSLKCIILAVTLSYAV